MKKIYGKILLVDDQPYEKELLEEAMASIDRFIKVEYFSKPKEALTHLIENCDEIFLIICDINMPGMSGMEFKAEIEKDSYLKQKSIPFIFVTSETSDSMVKQAYALNVQGYFEKPESIDGQAEILNKIIKYWAVCLHPIVTTQKE